MVVGLGGGSSMDSAKAIAVEATHKGTSWDYLFYKDTQPTEKTLPIIAISTTSGTGSQVTQVAVITNTQNRDKSAIYHPIVYPKVCIVDPGLMVTVPEHITAATGFDAFCHSFEAILHPNSSPYIELLGLSAIKNVVENLPGLLKNLQDKESRSKLALADTYAGLCIANAGVTLPHGIGMAIGGMYPHVMHGETLALNYPAFTRFTYPFAKEKFAAVGLIFRPDMKDDKEEVIAEQACIEIDKFLKEIGMWFGLKEFDVPKEEIHDLAVQSLVLPDYKGNPRVATLDEVEELLNDCYER
jgi:alcohol dehydrogenase